MPRRFLVILAAYTMLAAGCERRTAPPPSESTHATPAGIVNSTTARPATLWNAEAGPVLLVATETPGQAVVITPDTAADGAALSRLPQPASVTLLGRDGSVQVARVQPPTSGDPCDPWIVTSVPPPHAWSIGFIGGRVIPLAMDSVESATRADSAALVATVTRLASALPNDSAGRFAALPFDVRTAYRFTLPRGRQVVVATLIRQINQEASPLAERTFLVAERSGSDNVYSTAYHEQSRGREDTVEATDVLAAVLVGAARRPTLVVTRDFGDAAVFGFIERASDGRWVARWSSARRSC